MHRASREGGVTPGQPLVVDRQAQGVLEIDPQPRFLDRSLIRTLSESPLLVLFGHLDAEAVSIHKNGYGGAIAVVPPS